MVSWLESGGPSPFELGAAVAFGLMGMAEAIRANAPRVVERSYWLASDGKQYYDCFCSGCERVLMKKRTAGRDEGMDREWCGVCRWG